MIGIDLSPRTIGITKALILPIQLQLNPLEHVEDILERVHTDPVLSPEEYVEALDEALASESPIARLLPEYHPEVILRRYLAEVRRRLALPYN